AKSDPRREGSRSASEGDHVTSAVLCTVREHPDSPAAARIAAAIKPRLIIRLSQWPESGPEGYLLKTAGCEFERFRTYAPAGGEQTANRAKRTHLRHLTSVWQDGEQRWNCLHRPGAVEIQIARVEQPLWLDVTHRRQQCFFEMRIILFEFAEQRP